MTSGTTTIQDVAQRAGVSVTTVSRALRGTGPVASTTNERVLAAAESLRFIPARGGRTDRRHANGIVLEGGKRSDIVAGYEAVATSQGRGVRVLDTGDRSSAEAAVLDLAAQVDGLMVLGGSVPGAVIAELVDRGLPVVVVDRPPLLGVDVVDVEITDAARLIAKHLSGHGCSRICFVGADARRFAAVQEELPDARLDKAVCRADAESGRIAALRVLRSAERPDALLCGTDEIALGVLRAAEELGLQVPGDLAVTGWGEVTASVRTHPALTTVGYSMRAVGAAAARALDERIGGSRLAPRHQLVGGSLLVRRSCGFHPR
ncbi:LacI family DNA-binding transcriptional regulator [Saccharopolyspora taberi]|uniref:LacI family DNA-binding transcriptional regulator n=1 Tax=Saccharopolyspora taberi TaxID=60895 RepID=A0ABN3V9F8_9PSEU